MPGGAIPKSVPPLSEEQVSTAQPREKLYCLFDGNGLFLAVTPTGSKIWRWAFHGTNKKKNQLTFGRYPDVSIGQARNLGRLAAQLLKAGIDPAENRDQLLREASRQGAQTFERVARDWHQDAHAWQAGTARNILHRLEADIFPHVGSRPIATISPDELIQVLRQLEGRGSREIARRLSQICLNIMRYAKAEGLVPDHLAAGITSYMKSIPGGDPKPLTIAELPKFVRNLRQNRGCMSRVTVIAMELQLLTLVRTVELIETPWDEVDLGNGQWTIRANRIKHGWLRRESDASGYQVHLSPRALNLLVELQELTGSGNLLFPNRRESSKPISNNTLLKAVQRMGYAGDLTGECFRRIALANFVENRASGHEDVGAREPTVPGTARRHTPTVNDLVRQWADFLDQLS